MLRRAPARFALVSTATLLVSLVALPRRAQSADPIDRAQSAAPVDRAQSGDPLDRAQAEVDAGRADEALALVEPVLKRDRRNARALLIRSTARCLEGDLPACKKDLDAALDADPKLRQGWLNRSALAIAEKRYDDALAALREAEKLDPQASDNGLNQGAVLLLQGQLEPASAQFAAYLELNPTADAWYLVASNYAFSGYAALAVEHLAGSVARDERTRARARTDPNFVDLASNRAFQQLLSTDAFRPAEGSHRAEKVFRSRYAGADSPIVTAALNAIQLSGLPLDPLAEVTSDWAILWSAFRVKLLRNADDTTTITLTAPPSSYTPAQWTTRTDAFFTTLERELLRLELAKGREPKAP